MNFREFIEKYIKNNYQEASESDYSENIKAFSGKTNKTVITSEFKEVIDSLLLSSSVFSFVSGVAGTGKSVLIKEIKKKN